jgi:hypothetical protein
MERGHLAEFLGLRVGQELGKANGTVTSPEAPLRKNPRRQNLHTPEGQRYNAAFAEKIHTWMQPCVEELAGSDLGNFELLIKVGKEGTIEDITGGGNSPLM